MPITRVNIGNYTTTVFEGWIGNRISSTSTTSTLSNTRFNYWVQDNSTYSTNTTIFSNWITTSSDVYVEVIEPTRTPEERALLEAEAEARALVRQEEERKRRAGLRRAERKALVLLLHSLVEEQRVEMRDHGYFHVQGGATGTRYRIRKGRVANIDVLDGDQIKHRLCAHPGVQCPDYDTMAAQALHLGDAANEAEFIRVANIHPVRAA